MAAKFCGKCGKALDPQGLCPDCDAGKAFAPDSQTIACEAPETAPAPEAAPAPAPAAAPGAGEEVKSPMPGTILSVNVKAGDAVKKGQVLMILEAMKMENEIMAGSDGTVTSVMVAAGQAVEAGAALCTIQ